MLVITVVFGPGVALSCFVTSLWVSLSVSINCAEAVPFQLVLVAWISCMFVWVCSHVIRLGYHVDFIRLLVWCACSLPEFVHPLYFFRNDLAFAGGFMKLWLL